MKNLLLFIVGLLLFSCGQESSSDAQKKSTPENSIEQVPSLPNEVKFCGKNIPMDDHDVRQRLDREFMRNLYFHSSTILAIKNANRYFPIIESILKEEGLPDDFKYLSLIESNLNPWATSPTGARGLWQFMPEAAKQYGLKISSSIDERLDVQKSTRAACRYLKNAYSDFGDWTLAAAAYNRGNGGIRGDLARQKVDNYFDLLLNAETGRYVFRLIAMKIILENSDEYGFNIPEKDKYTIEKMKAIEVTESIQNLTDWAISNNTTYRKVRLLNPSILGNSLKLSNDTLVIHLPYE